jgi:hypothetical protein
MSTLPSTYESSRERFRSSLASFSTGWLDSRVETFALPHDSSLTIDVIIANANKQKENLFIMTTGLHGIEGYVGSGIIQLFIEEYLPKINPDNTGVVIVHPINPHGMKYHQRVNKNSIDLNRNFNTVDFEKLKEVNPHYETFSFLLNPARKLQSPFSEKIKFLLNVIQALPRGIKLIRETALMGQYRIHNGMQFGGFELQEETKIMISLYDKVVKDYKKIIALDIHTGYGPRYQMTLLNPPSVKESAEETARRFKVKKVAGVNPEEFYSINGDMSEYLHQMMKEKYPDKKLYAGAFEFGTYGDSLWQAIRSLRITVVEHAFRWFGGSDSMNDWVQKEYDELFLPSEKNWWQKAQADAREAFDGILSTEGFFRK